ncbi:Cysteine-rich RLK (RECEPTOR-like protein kinase) 8 [Theobroma cacao]|uniref:Cysteine-rich RLK (RECEPTOR-like protein kinase) 8 n=1 Tax=Theobroma cacao TaxID=3641 RepID=A0A061F9J4_THECC|nr:Cysteine-rich RLK (RECEPTOR-like protein kinase) 8 [Theobroma cacao]
MKCSKWSLVKTSPICLIDETPKKNKKSKKAMMAIAWSDRQISSSETDDEKSEERANICLMAQEDETEVPSSPYINSYDDLQDEYTWVYFLAHKNDALQAFLSHCKKVENEKGLAIVSIRSDHGGEFENDEFEKFYNEKGLDHNFCAPRTPQQNGVVERKDRTLNEMARTLLCQNNLPKYLWAEAVNTAAYILNRVLIRPLISKTPYELYKALYGLKQAPRAWYEKLSKFLVEKGYDRGSIDTTLFIKRYLNNLIVVQIYVDDIVFGATNEALCKNFAKEMQGEFEMSMMGELKYFLGLQLKQSEEGVFINQESYTHDMLKKFDMLKLKSISTPMSPSTKLDLDEKVKDVDQKLYRGMIDSLLYLTVSRPDI